MNETVIEIMYKSIIAWVLTSKSILLQISHIRAYIKKEISFKKQYWVDILLLLATTLGLYLIYKTTESVLM